MENKKKTKIGILGFGNMGSAIFKLLQQQAEFKKNTVFFIYSPEINQIKDATCVKNIEELFCASDIVFLCIKPQDFYLLPVLNFNKSKKLIVISIMAGVPIDRIKKIIPSSLIIRTMPNLPLQIGMGMIGWYADKNHFSASELLFIKKIFSYFGEDINVVNEKMIDAITAISGSGPAYVFLFINALVSAARNLGFNKEEAEKIVLQTAFGSLDYLKKQNKMDLEQLIKKVTSKKGTTEAALEELNVARYKKQWQKATNRAYKRAGELSTYDGKRT